MSSSFSAAGHFSGEFDEAALQEWAKQLRAQLPAQNVSLGLIFISPTFFPHASQVLEVLRLSAQIPILAGCSSQGLIYSGFEIEENPGIVLALYSLPGVELHGVHISQSQVEEAEAKGFWQHQTGIDPSRTNGWLTFLDPFSMDSEAWLKTWNRDFNELPVLGGLASGNFREQVTQLYLNGEVYQEGGVALSVGGAVELRGVTCQGCTPIGETWTLTKVEENVIHTIGNRPAYKVLAETFNELAPDDQRHAQGNLLIGLAMDEYVEEFHRGDFLIRNLLRADSSSGSLAIGALPRPGQTVQFQLRSARAANEDMQELLTRAKQRLGSAKVYGGCLCSCNGRGQGLFGRPNHDAGMVQSVLGPIGLAGFFCNGEIGPVGKRNFLHGYTASLALFVEKLAT